MIRASHLSRVVRAAEGLRLQKRFESRNASFATSAGGRLLNPNPRPTQYQTVVVNEAVNPAPGKPVSFTPYLVGLAAFMILFPCIQTTIELNNYYKETEELYREGWNRHHYDKMKNEYLSKCIVENNAKRNSTHINVSSAEVNGGVMSFIGGMA